MVYVRLCPIVPRKIMMNTIDTPKSEITLIAEREDIIIIKKKKKKNDLIVLQCQTRFTRNDLVHVLFAGHIK
jgi:hypothetical protein